MQYKIFTIPVASAGEIDELNNFLKTHRVFKVKKEFVVDSSNSFWSFCVEYISSDGFKDSGLRKKSKVDYKNVLTPAEFAVFSRLRECRKGIAQEEALPAFAVCVDEHLAAMAKMEKLDESVLQRIEGFGKTKQEKYGLKFINAHKNLIEEKKD